MPSTYTPNLGLEKPGTGEQAGVWGDTANKSYDFLDTATDGNASITLSSGSFTLQTDQGVLSNGRNKVINFGGNLAADATITIAPNTAEKIYFIRNLTTGGFGLLVRQGTGATYRIAPGKSAAVYAEGSGAGAAVYGVLADFQVDSLLAASITVTNLAFTGAATFAQAASFTGGVTISPSLTLNLGSDAAYDMYYRSSGGSMARLGIGTNGQVLMATATGPSWQPLPSVGIGSAVAGATGNRVLYADSSLNLAQDDVFCWGPSIGLGVGMYPTLGGLCVGGTLTARMMLYAGVQNTRELVFASAIASVAKTRWVLSVSTDAESGSNAGAGFLMASYDDAGTLANYNQCWYRNGRTVFGQHSPSKTAQVTIVNQTSGQDGLQIWGFSAANKLQSWRQVDGTEVGSMDYSGNLVLSGNISAAGGSYLTKNAQNQLVLNATMASPPPPAFQYATLHLGADTSGFAGPSIGLENASTSPANFPQNKNYTRIFVRNHNLVIQYDVGGTIRYVYLPLAAGSVTWFEGTSPPA